MPCPIVRDVNINKAGRLARVKAMAASGQAREVRLRCRLSLRDVALAVGVDASTVGRWEGGSRIPRGDAAWRYADLIDRLDRQVPA